jgi:CHAT domain-containing protein
LDTRRALLSRLKAVGKYNQDTAQFILLFANLLVEQARFADAEKLARTAVEIYQALGFPDDAQAMVAANNQVAVSLFAQGRYQESKEAFETVSEAIKSWDPKRSARYRFGWSRIFTLYYTGEVEKGVELAREYVAGLKARVGDRHFDTAVARAILASGLAFARRDAEALQEFRAAMPIVIAGEHASDADEATSRQAADIRLQNVAEVYITLLARSSDQASAALESFQLGEAIRGRSVQAALAASGARAVAGNPALAELARKDQDLEKEISAQIGALNNMLALPPEERDDNEVRAQQGEIDKLRTERRAAQREIARRFPEYASLVAPQPMSVEDIRAALMPEEAFVSFHFGRRGSFAWAVPKNGPVAFAAISATARQIDTKIVKLRSALAPEVSTVEEIPPFDLALAHELYKTLLDPIQSGWQSAKSLIVVTNGALGTLPLSLLPTAPATLASSDLLFAGYRNVAWLARTHSVTALPSAASLRTLRRLLPAPGERDALIGFGDPFFNEEQALEGQRAQTSEAGATTTRGVPIRLRAAPKMRGVDSADVAMLPRLPDTAEELKSIALTLHADPARALYLGKSANEQTVKSIDLSRYRVVVFATHGLVPGELDGLTQPALALSAPNVADVDGDGLLTMGEILGLRLNADWVVLSACNTGAAAAAGAEAASGLGRAFFYAGTRALLVTNWSVHSDSARELVTDLFRRQSLDPNLTRAEALRQAMVELIDHGSWKGPSGQVLFSYAHPLFWAPYSIIGDGS